MGIHSPSTTVSEPIGPNALAEAMGLVAWTFDPAWNTAAATQTNAHLGALFLEKGKKITGFAVGITIAGAGLTDAQLGIYDAGLGLLAATPTNPTAFQTTGWVSVNLATPFVTPYTGLYYLGFAVAGTTSPTIINAAQTNALSTGLPGGFPRGVHAQVQGTLPNPAIPQGGFTNMPVILAY
jgi:hypothetical protein